MKYVLGKPFICESIGQSKAVKPIDYYIPTENDNFKYLTLVGREAGDQFESEFIRRREQRQQYERDKY